MKKRVLVLHYSQTGQLTNVLENMIAPLKSAKNIEVVMTKIESTENFSFPWSFFKFFDAFPETVYLDGPRNKSLDIANIDFDLIIIGYQPWFLSPSMPMSSFMKSDEAKIILKDKPVITVIGCRNMWIEAQKTMKELIEKCDSRLIDNVVLTDQSGPLESFVTTPRWMLTGKKDAFYGLSPAGINAQDIKKSSRFGERILEKLNANAEKKDEPMLTNLGAVKADDRFVFSEKIAKRSFRIWGKLIRLFGKRGAIARRPIVVIYVAFLFTLIITVVPINMMVQTLLRRVFKEKNDKILIEIEKPSGR
ncbi:MAG: dialkylresorcinol condensing enzyme [Sulfurovaceae bacterium]|nr:dialkylresorcinol condensing enzyme [Sulfurovaceae bacterium]MDD5548512.1 dialkylresorcinol condensing enzyme [Sulfurovaceae bacterium]